MLNNKFTESHKYVSLKYLLQVIVFLVGPLHFGGVVTQFIGPLYSGVEAGKVLKMFQN